MKCYKTKEQKACNYTYNGKCYTSALGRAQVCTELGYTIAPVQGIVACNISSEYQPWQDVCTEYYNGTYDTSAVTCYYNCLANSVESGNYCYSNETNAVKTETETTLSYPIRVRVTGNNKTTTSGTKNVTLPMLNTPIYTEAVQGEVTINYPSVTNDDNTTSTCNNGLTCQYSIDGGNNWTTVTSNPSINFGTDGSIIAKASDNTNEVSSTYAVTRNKLYVASTGNDSSGYGTINHPYATLQKAYTSANSTSTIYVMDDITASSTTTMDSNKDITLTSCTKSGNGTSATCPTNSANTITRGTDLMSSMIKEDAGSLALNTITLDGNKTNVESEGPIVRVAAALTVNSGATLQNNLSTYGYGGALYIIDTTNVTINGGTFSNNSAPTGGAINIRGASVNIKGGTISNNSSTTGSGGGIFVETADSVLTVQGGTISENTATADGGGIFMHGNSTLNISGGTIESNTAKRNGGGIELEQYNNTGPTATITGGSITKNTADNAGSGIFNAANSTLTVGGTATINGNPNSSSAYPYPENVFSYGTFTDQKVGLTVANTNYFLKPRLASTLALDVNGGTVGNGTNVQVYTKANSNRMKWGIKPRSVVNGLVHYGIFSAVGSNQILVASSTNTASGSNVLTWTINGSPGGLFSWNFEKTGSYYKLKNAGYPTLCLSTAKTSSVTSGTNVNITTCATTPAATTNSQQWTISTS